jgi:predicted Zn-dependent protease
MISKFVLLLCLVWSLAAAVAQEDKHAAARAELSAGVEAFRLANYEDAVDHFKRAVSLDPESTIGHLYLATSYGQMFVPGVDNPDNVVQATSALSEYGEVLRRTPSNVVALKGIAYLKLELKNYEQAKQSYQKAIAVEPHDPELFYSAAVADWSMAYRDIAAEKAKLSARSGESLFLSKACADARTAALANVDDGLAMLTKAMSLREDYEDAMAYMNLLYRLRADLDCGNKEANDADLQKADEWADLALAVRKKKNDAAAKANQDSGTEAPPR